MQVSRPDKKLTVLPVGGTDVAACFRSFDVHKTKAHSIADEHALKAIIESNFGNLTAFNKRMHQLADTMECEG